MNTKKSRKAITKKAVKNLLQKSIDSNLFSKKKNTYSGTKTEEVTEDNKTVNDNKTITDNKKSRQDNVLTKKKADIKSRLTIDSNHGLLKSKKKVGSLGECGTIEKTKELVSKKSNMQSKNTKVVSINKTVKLENYDDFNMDPSMVKETIKQLVKYQWYHGLLPRDDVSEFLKNEGDYLVRKSEVNNLTRFILSVKWKNNQINHVVLNWRDGEWYVSKGEVKCKQLDQLLMTCLTKKIPIGNNKSIIRNAVNKPPYYIDHEHVSIIKEIGHGAFGRVSVGTCIVNGMIVNCAIKSLKIGKKIDKHQRKEFVKEAKINLKLKHENIVNLYGFAIDDEPLMIILEFCRNGALNSYLKKHPETSNALCTDFVIDACRGMCYLSSKNIIHRDLAARNCLIDENLKVKISDFGLSVANVVSITLNAKTKVPIKWLSPETIKEKQFNLATDVWSFGVVIWEIFSRCQSEPYPKQSNTEAKEIIVSGKLPMNAPPNTPEFIGEAMNLCFTQDPKLRPTFRVLFKHLSPNEVPPCDTTFCTY